MQELRTHRQFHKNIFFYCQGYCRISKDQYCIDSLLYADNVLRRDLWGCFYDKIQISHIIYSEPVRRNDIHREYFVLSDCIGRQKDEFKDSFHYQFLE